MLVIDVQRNLTGIVKEEGVVTFPEVLDLSAWLPMTVLSTMRLVVWCMTVSAWWDMQAQSKEGITLPTAGMDWEKVSQL